MDAKFFNQTDQLTYPAIDVGSMRVSSRSEQMWNRFCRIVYEVPNLVIRPEWFDELPARILDLGFLHHVLLLLFLKHLRALSLLVEYLLDFCLNIFWSLLDVLLALESIENNVVFDVFQHLGVDVPQLFCTCKPCLLVL